LPAAAQHALAGSRLAAGQWRLWSGQSRGASHLIVRAPTKKKGATTCNAPCKSGFFLRRIVGRPRTQGLAVSLFVGGGFLQFRRSSIPFAFRQESAAVPAAGHRSASHKREHPCARASSHAAAPGDSHRAIEAVRGQRPTPLANTGRIEIRAGRTSRFNFVYLI